MIDHITHLIFNSAIRSATYRMIHLVPMPVIISAFVIFGFIAIGRFFTKKTVPSVKK